MKGHLEDVSTLAYKEGDEGKFVVRMQSTDKLLVLSTSGKFYTLEATKLPGGRGHGEPIRLMADMEST